jgi:predicted nucleic acid-binding protein
MVEASSERGVVTRLAEVDEDRVFLSVVTLAEIRYGIERMAGGNRRDRLDGRLRNELPLRFEGRILSVEEAVADVWGRSVAQCKKAGRPISPIDVFLAATAERHGLTLVTRNTSDFARVVKSVLNPWTDD